jgi:hypothetical protein
MVLMLTMDWFTMTGIYLVTDLIQASHRDATEQAFSTSMSRGSLLHSGPSKMKLQGIYGPTKRYTFATFDSHSIHLGN